MFKKKIMKLYLINSGIFLFPNLSYNLGFVVPINKIYIFFPDPSGAGLQEAFCFLSVLLSLFCLVVSYTASIPRKPKIFSDPIKLLVGGRLEVPATPPMRGGG